MTPAERIHEIRDRLEKAFAPTHLEILDDSAKHQGHAGAKDGAGHYKVIISADCFKNKNRIDVHRQIYQVLDDLIPKEIHALAIQLKSS